ncbi:TRAP transporter TatT component family protein [Nitrosomonas sp. JL21]|uniref:TRAP transporter TatT component family protein n=1 Tax=Nitrosomonas sp. JL21 TaxID=153949 RepID=UPI001F044592|nr:TRAP transporter TatT component family protein [Nitrosomonas sp. JL21]
MTNNDGRSERLLGMLMDCAMNALMKSNLQKLEGQFIHLLSQLIAVACLTVPLAGQDASATLLTPENQQKIELAVWKYAIDRPLLVQTIEWFRNLTRDSREPTAIAELSRLEFMRAQLELDKKRRIQLFENCINVADQALALNENEVRGLFWKAAAMGKMAEDSGVLNALRMLRPMEKMLLNVVALDEKYENAGGHRALGRMYHKLPGFPISFGSNQKALKHLKRAHDLFPQDVITRAFYAELLLDEGKMDEARKHADFVLATPIAEEDAREYAEYVNIALAVIEKTGGAPLRLGSK